MNLAQLSASGGFLHLKHAHNRLETVVEKEIKQSPQQRMSAEGMDPTSMEVLAIKHMSRKPQEKCADRSGAVITMKNIQVRGRRSRRVLARNFVCQRAQFF
ncbi:unnamed protein product [Durusdinium trenchii]|uniref:Uncharacterized protein n=1 Tax=Durusdinium trenchii TaxID=1381693 RepID=A0ABP0JU35_9DINO